MTATVAGARRPGEVQTLDPNPTLPLIGAVKGPTTVQAADEAWILPLIERAIDQTMARKAAALSMGLDQSQMTRQLTGDGHLSVRRLGALGEDFWRALIDELRTHFGMENDAERLRRALDARAACDRVIEELARKAVVR